MIYRYASMFDEIIRLRECEQRLKLFEETTFEAITVYDENLRCIDTNSMTTTLFQYSKEEVIGMSGLDFFDPAYKPVARSSVSAKNREPYEALMRRKDGTTFPALIQGTSIVSNGRNLRVSTCRDITELKRFQAEASQKEAEFRTIFETSPVGIFLTDESRQIMNVNPAAAQILGYDGPEELIGKGIRIIHLTSESYDLFGRFYKESLLRHESLKFDYQFRKKNGVPVWVNVSGSAVDHAVPPDLNKGVIWCIDDISVRKAVEAELTYLSRTDPLTGIFNRTYFMELGRREAGIHLRHNRSLAVMMLDLDHFKAINDTYGHSVGDDALRFLATLCQSLIRDSDIFGRLGGEEFAILLLETDSDAAFETAERIRTELKGRSSVKEGIPTMKVSIGLTKLADESLESALHRSDTLLYQAKNAGRDRTISDF